MFINDETCIINSTQIHLLPEKILVSKITNFNFSNKWLTHISSKKRTQRDDLIKKLFIEFDYHLLLLIYIEF